MKLYRKRFLLIVALAFFTICAWTIFSRNVSDGLKYASPSPNGSSSSSNFHQAPASAAATAAAIVAAKNDHHHQQQQQLQKVRNIVCNINGEYKVNCLKLMVAANSVSATKPESSVYVPFSLIHKYFEINGKVVTGSAKSGTTSEYFEWSHSYSKIFYPDEPYSSRGRFLWFANYNVEVRERVKCVSAAEAVPVSTQWYAKGHFYPTQIAQYGLSHFSKNLTEPAPQAFSLIEWPGGRLAGNVTSRPRLPAPAEGEDHLVISENTTLYLPESDGHHLGRDMTSFLVLDLTLQLPQDSHCSISVVIADSSDGKDGEEESLLVLQYSTAVTAHLRRGSPQYRMAVYGLGGSEEKSDSTKNVSAEWRPFTRDLLVDLYKGNLISSGRRSRPNRSLRVVRIELAGRMAIGRRAALLTSAHGHFALAAGDWLVRRQNAHGGWDIKVKRRLQSKSALGGGGNAQPPPPPPPPLVLAEGWHSAMAQGQAISLLARLYAHTGRPAYLAAAKRALALFEVEAFRGGVRARFLDRHVWYEEYPTVPSIFVLNGFIYSLFGLYDLGQICGAGGSDQAAAVGKTEDDPACLKAGSLFEEGVRSLEAMLPLFDSGSGSFYDLRHQALATVAPNVARWDYHSTHINQLLALQTVVRRDVFQATADRWIAYMRGHRAAHN